MLYPTNRIKKPAAPQPTQRKFYPPQMKSQAASMAAEGEEAKAPIVPTTNLKVAAAQQAASTLPTQPTGTMTGMSVGQAQTTSLPAGGTTTQGIGSLAPSGYVAGGVAPFTGQGPAIPGQGGVPANTQYNKPRQGSGLLLDSKEAFNPDTALESATEDLLTGDYSTADEEALIQELMRQQAGQDAADINARLGASGFGTSGALGALTSNVRSEAARKAAADIIESQRAARGERRADVGLAENIIGGQAGRAREDEKTAAAAKQAIAAWRTANPGKIYDEDGDGQDDQTGETQAAIDAKNKATASYNTEGAGTKQQPFVLKGEQMFRAASKDLRLQKMEGETNRYWSPVTNAVYLYDEYKSTVVV